MTKQLPMQIDTCATIHQLATFLIKSKPSPAQIRKFHNTVGPIRLIRGLPVIVNHGSLAPNDLAKTKYHFLNATIINVN